MSARHPSNFVRQSLTYTNRDSSLSGEFHRLKHEWLCSFFVFTISNQQGGRNANLFVA
ncbi:MAG: hypothetical protein ACI92S_005630, partial [Planctomycetaceae bacterium]